MAREYQRTLDSFSAHIDEVVHALEYLQKAPRIKANLGVMLDWENLERGNRSLAQEFMDLRNANETIILNGLYVTCVAAFEEFLRSSIEITVRGKLAKTRSFRDLGEPMINRHFKNSGLLLAQLGENADHLDVDAYTISKNLASCSEESEKVQMNVEALTWVSSITRLDQYFERMREIGVRVGYDELARFVAITDLLQAQRRVDARKELKEFVKTTVRTRNRIAHTTGTVSDVTSEGLRRSATLLREVAAGITRVLERQMQ